MSRLVLASSVIAVAEAGTLSLTFSDCGSKHGKVTTLSPTSFSTGTTATITGTGTIDEDVTSASIKATISALGTQLTDCSGDGTSDITCNLPLNTGSIVVPALPFPLKAGTLNLPVKVTTAASIPASLASVDIHLTGNDQNGESAICLDVHTSAAVSSDDAFEAFKAKYGKVYNGDEEEAAKATYFKNIAWAKANSNDEVQFGENQFADLTPEQYKVAAGLGYKKMNAGLPHLGVHEYQGEELAASVDWSTKGAVTPVKDQGQCGSCWAFSTTGGMEGAWQIASGSLTSMSEQQLVDCSTQNAGCNGGSMELAFNFAGTVNVATESSYPYTARDGSCKSSGYTTAIPQGGVTGYKSVGQSTDSLKSALQTGPVSVAIEADQMAFQLYSGGVLSSGCGTNLDHGVLAVGYDSNSFKVKNSWGSSWGSNGYLQISQSGNTCGIHSDASYPTVSASVAV
jgi:cathepsin L